MNKHKSFSLITILFVTLIFSVPLYLVNRAPAEESSVCSLPMEIDGWKGRDLPVEERSYQILETRNLILREYEKNGKKVYIYLIYSSDNRKVSHPPEVCFEGSGVTIIRKNRVKMPLDGADITANKLIVERGGIVNVVVYWYKAGNFYTANYMKQQAAIALHALKFKRTSGALIRVSAEAPSGDPQKAFEEIKLFSRTISKYFPTVIP